MPKDSIERLETDRPRRDKPIGFAPRPVATSLVEDGYVKSTVQSKLNLLSRFGQWLERGDYQSQISINSSLRDSSLTSSGRAESQRGSRNTFQFWIIFESVA